MEASCILHHCPLLPPAAGAGLTEQRVNCQETQKARHSVLHVDAWG